MPGIIGSTGWDRSRAWICDFSSGQPALVGRVAAVRDEQDCPPGHLRRCRSDSPGVGPGLLGQAVQLPLRNRQFVPLGLDLLELLCQLLGESVQFDPAGGDPLPLLHPPRPPVFRENAVADRLRRPCGN
ncbi:hypothetical protein ACQPXS_45680 [Streptomyces sp. CA-142005]|uniref:hypothetical protein n=1 Tax=Streptomyces sp. CA-142005 TaxID=3240052 RepID=UPI003D914105